MLKSMNEIPIYDLTVEDSVDKEQVATFPYAKLIDINPTDLGSIRSVFPSLLKITEHEMFYRNLKAVKCVLEFVTDVLQNCTTPQSKNEFVISLLLLNNLLSGMKRANQTVELDRVFIEIIFHISAYDNYCPLGSKYCVDMVLRVLDDMTDSDCCVVDEKIAKIIDNLIRIQADLDIARLTLIIFRRYPFSSETFSVYSKWLMHTTIRLLDNYSLEGVNEENPTLTLILRAVSKLLFETLKLSRNGSVNIPEAKTFLENVTNQVHKIIHLSCVSSVKQDARSILELILLKFLDEQHINMKENICEEVEKLPDDLSEWPYRTCKTFFWLCHLVYHSKRVVWSTSEICIAMSRLLYKPKYRILIDRHVLKSLLFIYPITLAGKANMKKKLIIGDDIQNIIVPEFMPLINDVLSIDPIQLKWILYKFPEKVKIAAVKFWLQNPKPQHFAILEESLLNSQSHDLLIDILIENPKNIKVLKLIENLQGRATFTNIQTLIDRHVDNLELSTLLLKIFRRVIPRNQNDAFKLLISMRQVLMMSLDDETLSNALVLVNNLINCLKSNQNCVNFLIEDQFWFKLLLSELNNPNEKLVKTVLNLLILLLGHCGSCKVKVLTFDLTRALNMTDSVVDRAVQFLTLVLRTGLLEPEKTTISHVFSQLCSLASVGKLTCHIYAALKSLLEKTEKLIFAPSLELLIEQKVSFSNRPDFSAECQQFIFYYIELVYSNKNAIPNMYYLPPKMLLVMFLRRRKDFPETSKFLRCLDEIYEIHNKIKSGNF